MTSNRNNLSLRILALGALVFTLAGMANAQPLRGKFSLPAEVRWGMATLQPGDYTFVLQGAASGNAVELVRNGRVVAVEMPLSHNPVATGPAVLVVDTNSRGASVREIRLPQVGTALYYAPPRPKHGTAAEEKETAQLIPITAAAR